MCVISGQNGPLALIFEIIGPKTLFEKYIGNYHFLGYSSLVSSSTPFFLSTVAPDHQQMKFKKLTGTHAHEARVPFSHVSPHLKPYFTPFTHNRAENTHSANLSISLSPSHSASQSRYHSTQIDEFSLSISRSASFSEVSLSFSLLHCLCFFLLKCIFHSSRLR